MRRVGQLYTATAVNNPRPALSSSTEISSRNNRTRLSPRTNLIARTRATRSVYVMVLEALHVSIRTFRASFLAVDQSARGNPCFIAGAGAAEFLILMTAVALL